MQKISLSYRRPRAVAAALLAPAIAVAFILCDRAAHTGTSPSGDDLFDLARCWLIASYFAEIVVFLPVVLVLRRYVEVSEPESMALLGAYAGWTAPVAYMLLMTVWRGDLLNAFVLEISSALLSPSNALVGALGGLLFWAIAAAPAPLTPREAIRFLVPRATGQIAPLARV